MKVRDPDCPRSEYQAEPQGTGAVLILDRNTKIKLAGADERICFAMGAGADTMPVFIPGKSWLSRPDESWHVLSQHLDREALLGHSPS